MNTSYLKFATPCTRTVTRIGNDLHAPGPNEILLRRRWHSHLSDIDDSRSPSSLCDRVGTTNMTQLGIGGLGVNPYFSTLLHPFERDLGRIPRGSLSGSAVAVEDLIVPVFRTETASSLQMPVAFREIGTDVTAVVDGALPMISKPGVGITETPVNE